LPPTVAAIKKTWQGKVKQWKPMYKDAIPQKPILPEPLSGTTLDVDGEKLEITGELQGDDVDNSVVWIPLLHTAVAGDIVYDGVFPWTAETTPDSRKAWIGSLDKISEMHPEKVVPGHQKPDKAQDPSNVQFTKDYLKDFDEALATSKTPAELQSKIKAKYPDVALDVILKIGADAAFKKPAKAAPKKK
jgi:glyoxylase-like metal-dependent hydrolase (beta-lactamase superfamily II)